MNIKEGAFVDNNNENNYRSCQSPNMNSETKAQLGEPLKAAPQKVSSEALFGANRELVIVHNGREYRLRLTQNDKLILTA
jgi:hemin uptake protein HemP